MNKVDQQIGLRVRKRRLALGLSLQQVADALGISYQQFHKNETGANRLPAGRLHALTVILDVSVGYFFDESLPRKDDRALIDPSAISNQPDLHRLSEAIVKIRGKILRRAILALIEAMADEAERSYARSAGSDSSSDRRARSSVSTDRRTAGRSINRKSSSKAKPSSSNPSSP